MGRACSMHETRNAYRFLVRLPEGKEPLGRHSHRCKNNIIMDFRETGWHCMDWNNLAQVTYQWQDCVNKVLNIWVAQNGGNVYRVLK
jgi:hypothetical protein